MSSLQRLPTDLAPFICHSVLLMFHLLSFIRAMCPAHFHFVLVTYWTTSVALVLCLMMVLRILSFSLTFSICHVFTWVKLLEAQNKEHQAGVQGVTRPQSGAAVKTDSSDYRGIDEESERARNVEFTRGIQGGDSFRLEEKRKKKKEKKKKGKHDLVRQKLYRKKTDSFFFLGGERGGGGGGGGGFQHKDFLICRFSKSGIPP